MPQQTARPNPVDVHVGARLRLRRKALGYSQERLGGAIGLTFQQIQKYERGANRISASTLHDICHVLEAPVSYFFDGLTESASATGNGCAFVHHGAIHALLSDPDGARLAEAFAKIRRRSIKKRLANLAQELAEDGFGPANDEDRSEAEE